ncbi:MAG TPA: hypothetical protein VEC36_11610 [Patescibacteria group bacterium]|nr:hypothetical protein [Patescibacteria group bacterium]
MSDRLTIEKIIRKAKENGFRFRNRLDYEDFTVSSFNKTSGGLVIMLYGKERRELMYDRFELIFYEVAFAKAIFGKSWAQHLRELTNAPDKIEYLSNFLEN